MKLKLTLPLLTLIITAVIFAGCGKSPNKRRTIESKPVSVKQFDTPPGADPSVSAEQGGNGFTGDGWQTKTDYNVIGDPNAVKGGQLTMAVLDFPATLRIQGKDANTTLNFMMQSMAYESLLAMDPVNEEFMPALATHWKISDDKKQFWFRINPNARWADGKPVTAEDVIATWKLMVDPGILEAYSNILYGTYEQPVAESKYIVSVKSKELNWRQFIYFAVSMPIMPAHYIGNIDGKTYLEKYQFDFIPGSGPYVINQSDINKGQSIILRRRSDYWAENERFNIGLNNFDAVRFEVIEDENLAFEKLKKGDIDVLNINRAQRWANEFTFDEYNRGLVQKRRVFNENPNGTQGLAFNMRKAPFDDIRIRKAFTLLWDRKKFNDKLFYNMYELDNSYYPGSVYENPSNPKNEYNLEEAQKLLAEAGWSQKNDQGYLVKNGQVFEIELPFTQGADRYLTIYQEDLKKAGIKLNLKQVDGTTNFKLGNERNFTLLTSAWTGLRYPNPESSFKSNTADEPNTTNWPGVKNARIDEICDQYNVTFDRNERIKQIREIDGILANMYPYCLGWYGPYQRVAFQNKFGYPEWILPRTSDFLAIPQVWYIDPDKLAAYDEGKKDKAKTMEKGQEDHKFWLDVKSREEKGEKISIGGAK